MQTIAIRSESVESGIHCFPDEKQPAECEKKKTVSISSKDIHFPVSHVSIATFDTNRHKICRHPRDAVGKGRAELLLLMGLSQSSTSASLSRWERYLQLLFLDVCTLVNGHFYIVFFFNVFVNLVFLFWELVILVCFVLFIFLKNKAENDNRAVVGFLCSFLFYNSTLFP